MTKIGVYSEREKRTNWGVGGEKEVFPQDKLCQLLCVEKFPKVG